MRLNKLSLIWAQLYGFHSLENERVFITPTSEWDLRHDIQYAIQEGFSPEKFDDTGLYEKYISNFTFDDDEEMKVIGSAGYISEKLLQKLIDEILASYQEIVTIVSVPNDEADRTYVKKEFQTVLKFRIQDNDPAYKPHIYCPKSNEDKSSIFLNAAHHSKELASIQMVSYTMLKMVYEYQFHVMALRLG